MSDDLARLVLDSMRCGVVTVDRQGRVTTLNGPAREWLGLGDAPLLGDHCRQAFSSCPAVAHLLLDALERGTLPDRAELELSVAGQRRLLIGFSLSRIEDGAGGTLGSAIFFKDLTAVEEEREREALRNRLASLGEVAAQLAHEIRNRLGGIRLFLGLARRRLEGDDEGTAYLERAEAELLEANAKMGEMLDFVRPLQLETEPRTPESLCREALDATLARFPEAQMEVVWEVEPDLPRVEVDPARIRDALANLFANAVEATAQRGTIRIHVCAQDAPVLQAAPPRDGIPGLRGFGEALTRRISIEIADDGPGIPADVLRRIFHPFFTTKDAGSGLGVPTAQKILDAHAGTLDVTSLPGQGCVFIIRLPAQPTSGGDGG